MCSVEFRAHGDPHDADLVAMGVDYAQVVDFSVSTNPYGPSADMLDAIRAASVERYPDPTASAARRALGDVLDANPDDIVLGNGAAELLWSLADVLLGDNGRALVVEPTFCEFRAACAARGTPVVEWRATEEHGFAIDLHAVGEKARRAGATVVYLCAPNTPTGFCLPASEIAAWAAAHHGISVILDQSFLTLSDRHADIATPMPSNVVCVRSLTKDHAIPGVRIGYAVASAEVARGIGARRPAWTVSAAAQAAAAAACGLADFVERSRRAVLADRAELSLVLGRAGLHPHTSSTAFVLARVGNARKLQARLLTRHRILVRDCASFGLPGHVRIAARPAADRAALARALE